MGIPNEKTEDTRWRCIYCGGNLTLLSLLDEKSDGSLFLEPAYFICSSCGGYYDVQTEDNSYAQTYPLRPDYNAVAQDIIDGNWIENMTGSWGE